METEYLYTLQQYSIKYHIQETVKIFSQYPAIDQLIQSIVESIKQQLNTEEYSVTEYFTASKKTKSINIKLKNPETGKTKRFKYSLKEIPLDTTINISKLRNVLIPDGDFEEMFN